MFNRDIKIKDYLAEMLQDLDYLPSNKVQEYKPKVDHGELTWEPEPFMEDPEPIIDSIIPDKILDIPKPDSKLSGKSAQTPSAKVSRKYSNTIRSFFDD